MSSSYLRMQNKTALITGAASGIGLAIAQRFAEEGARIALSDLNLESATKCIGTLNGDGHLALALDVSNENDWAQAMQQIDSEFGRLDCLVNNAGIPAQGTIEDANLADWRKVTSINLDGTFLGCKSAIAAMKPQGGSIINVSSVGALKGSLVGPAYGASKAAVWNLTKTVALHCAKSRYGIRCNSLHPGLTRTPMMDQMPEETLDRLATAIPMGELGQPLDIANAALYLASDESRYTTGTSLVVDGGYII